MLDDARLSRALTATSETERAIRFHLGVVKDSASEQARGQVAFRHCMALRKSLEDWIETRAYRSQQQETDNGKTR